MFLNRKAQKLDANIYNKILALPFITNEEVFEETLEEIHECDFISDAQIDYLNAKLKTKKLWAKCFLKPKFTGGMSTTSRIEGLHAKQAKYFTSNTRLQGIFYGFKSIEKVQISRFNIEYQREKGEITVQNV